MFNDKKSFNNWLLLSGKKDRTIQQHLSLVEKIVAETASKGQIDYELFVGFIASKREVGLKNSYINHFIKSLHTYCLYLDDFKIPYDGRLKTIRYLREEETNKEIFSVEELEAFLALPAPTHSNKQNYQMWSLWFRLLAMSGARPHEISALDSASIDIPRQTITIQTSKTGVRVIPLPKPLVEPLRKLVAENDRKYLFATQKNGVYSQITSTDWYYQWKARITRLAQDKRFEGIDRRPNLTVYSIRHSFGSHLCKRTNNVFLVKRLMGHRKLATTERYYHEYDMSELSQAANQLPIIAKNNPKILLGSLKEVIEGFKFDSNPRIKQTLTVSEDALELKIEIVK